MPPTSAIYATEPCWRTKRPPREDVPNLALSRAKGKHRDSAERWTEYDLPIPAAPFFAGFDVATQALHIGGVQPFALSNAQDLHLGF